MEIKTVNRLNRTVPFFHKLTDMKTRDWTRILLLGLTAADDAWVQVCQIGSTKEISLNSKKKKRVIKMVFHNSLSTQKKWKN